MTAAAPPPTDLKSTLEDLRASVAARRGRMTLLHDALLSFLEALIALVTAFRAGRLAPPAPATEHAASSARDAVVRPSPRRAGSGVAARLADGGEQPARGTASAATPRVKNARTAPSGWR